jgi:hypothetical protein
VGGWNPLPVCTFVTHDDDDDDDYFQRSLSVVAYVQMNNVCADPHVASAALNCVYLTAVQYHICSQLEVLLLDTSLP